MKSVYILVAIILLPFISCIAQIKNAKTSTVKIYGNCGMCENTIEKAGTIKKVAKVDWDKDTKLASITYDSTKTSEDEILKRMALAGYDSDEFLAPDDVYAKLPECCQYDRTSKPGLKMNAHMASSGSHSEHSARSTTESQEADQLTKVFDSYFALKDALVKSDGNLAAAKAKDLNSSIQAVKMEKLTTEEHQVFMAVMKDLSFDVGHITETKDMDLQRSHFTTLSDNIYKLIKVSQQQTPVYYQHCPMYDNGKGANWLSKESAIKNPYYGSQMLTCGKTVETIK